MLAVQDKSGRIRIVQMGKNPIKDPYLPQGVWMTPLAGLLSQQALIKYHHDLMWGGTNQVPLSQVIPTINRFIDDK